MEAQMENLRAMAEGNAPTNAESLLSAFNRDILSEAADKAQVSRIETIMKLVNAEEADLEAAVQNRRAELEKLDSVTFEPHVPVPQIPVDRFRDVLKQLSETRFQTLNIGPPNEIFQILWGLIETASRNECLVVPKGLKSVEFLSTERLITAEKAGPGSVRILL